MITEKIQNNLAPSLVLLAMDVAIIIYFFVANRTDTSTLSATIIGLALVLVLSKDISNKIRNKIRDNKILSAWTVLNAILMVAYFVDTVIQL